VNYREWKAEIPATITHDKLWKVKAYRLALFLGDLGWRDVTTLMGDRRTLALSGQLYRAVGSVSANLAEGYSRGTGKDRARFFEYALGSARERRDWYYKGRYVLGEAVTEHRISLVTEIIRLLLTMIPQQRGRVLREASVTYESEADWGDLDHLLTNVPVSDS